MARRWWGKAPVYEDGRKTPVGYEDLEFNVVAEAIGDKNTILVGECKWKSADYADRLLAKLKAKTLQTQKLDYLNCHTPDRTVYKVANFYS